MTLDNDLDVLREAAEAANLKPEEREEGGIILTVRTPEQARSLYKAQVELMPSSQPCDPYPDLSL